MTKTEIAKRLNITRQTYQNWESTKPELIKLINLGLEKEKELQSSDKTIHLDKEMQEELKELIKIAKEIKEERKNK